MPEFTMPSLGADMDAGTLTEWLVKPGDEVHRGDIVAVVETDKAAIEVECFAEGTVGRLLVDPGTTVPVGTPLAIIDGDGIPDAATPDRPDDHETALSESGGLPVSTAALEAVPGSSSPVVRRLAQRKDVDLRKVRGTGRAGGITRADVERAARERPRASPLARRLARDLGIDLRDITGTGAHGIIRGEDVRHAAKPPKAAGPPPTLDARPARRDDPPAREAAVDKPAAMRRAIAGLMARSKREIPHYYLSTTIDMGPALDWLRERNRKLPVGDRLVPAALLLKASALAAHAVPELNGHWTDDHFVPAEQVHLGVATALRAGGLVAPVLHAAETLGHAQIMAGLKDLVTRARSGRLRGSDLTGGTMTVTNLGDRGVESVAGVIFPPQVALVGFGRIVERPWAVDGLLGIRPVVTVTLSADHRATDGGTGADFLDAVTRLLRNPEES